MGKLKFFLESRQLRDEETTTEKKKIIYNEATIKTLTVCLPPQQIIKDLPKKY